MEKKTIELDGKLYEIKLVEPVTTEPKLPTLESICKMLQPTWVLDECNKVVVGTKNHHGTHIYQSQLSTEAQCKRIQTIIAMQKIADYYNGEVDYRGKGYIVYFYQGSMESRQTDVNYPYAKFKKREHAQLAIEILRNENLLDNLK